MRHLVHELHTPLAAMAAALELLGTDPTDTATLDAAISAQRHVVSLVTRARALIPSNRPLSGTPVRLSDLVIETAAMVEPLGSAVGCVLAVEPDSSTAIGDRHAIRQIVVNLLANAFKYAPGTGVTISTGSDASGVWIQVADGGEGIPADRWDALLHPGSRLEEHADISGEGLGLALSCGLAEAMHGRLELQPGPGTTVRVHLPSA